MSLFAALVFAFAGVASPARADDEGKKAADALQGEWKYIQFTKLGRDNPDVVKKGKVVIAGDKMTFTDDDEETVLVFVLDPGVNPAAVDLKRPDGKQVIRGIYKLEKDKLTVCFGIENSRRPTEFKSDRDNSVIVLERVKK